MDDQADPPPARHAEASAVPTPEPLLDLAQVVARLRAADGCPWDRQQSIDSVRRYLLEEVYELLEALESVETSGPLPAREEMGDVLFQIAFLARLFEERGAFDLETVARAAAEKMVRRHPHVFAKDRAGLPASAGLETAADVLRSWSDLKADARDEARGARSILAGVAKALPALERALELSDRAGQQGFDWANAAAVMTKVEEELAELRDAIATGDRVRIDDELGDLLFALANLARKLGRSPELALQGTNAKFIRRFSHVETRLREQGKTPKESTLDEMDRLWNEAKALGL